MCYLIKATEKLKQLSGNLPGSGAFEQLFGPVRGEFEQKFSKNSNARGIARGGDVVASISLVHYMKERFRGLHLISQRDWTNCASKLLNSKWWIQEILGHHILLSK